MYKTSAASAGPLAAIVLAAGGSSRLGRPKQLLRRGGVPLIVRAARLARQTVDGSVIVVLGAGHLRLRGVLRRYGLDPAIAHNARWAEGMAGSLRTGIERLPARTAGALILLVDQAALARRDLARLVGCWRARPGHAAAAVYAGRLGAPAVIPRRLCPAVRSLAGDTGARKLLRGLGDVTPVGMPVAAFDVDTPADAAALRTNRARSALRS